MLLLIYIVCVRELETFVVFDLGDGLVLGVFEVVEA